MLLRWLRKEPGQRSRGGGGGDETPLNVVSWSSWCIYCRTQVSKLSKNIKNRWSSALETLIYPLEGFWLSVETLPQTLTGSDKSYKSTDFTKLSGWCKCLILSSCFSTVVCSRFSKELSWRRPRSPHKRQDVGRPVYLSVPVSWGAAPSPSLFSPQLTARWKAMEIRREQKDMLIHVDCSCSFMHSLSYFC